MSVGGGLFGDVGVFLLVGLLWWWSVVRFFVELGVRRGRVF